MNTLISVVELLFFNGLKKLFLEVRKVSKIPFRVYSVVKKNIHIYTYTCICCYRKYL